MMMANQLAHANSPYLLQHAENPVDWFQWGQEALHKAKVEDKPIFLSIGYAACHWCHVMAHESFEDPATAEIMNEFFVNIKVDREERPDIDNIYMDAVVALSGRGGWPLSVFLSPDQKPFYGGTYFPPVPRYNMPSFRELLLTIAKLWREDRERLLKSSNQITEYLAKNSSLAGETTLLSETYLEQAAANLVQTYDWKHGGWGRAPKFPQPMALMFLLRRAAKGDKPSLDVAVHALKAMAQGGMYDLIGGGFARYSTDNDWLVPHFEKMLYDNAQLSRAYLHAYLLTGDGFFRQVCESTLQFVMRELTHPSGGFFSSLDADSEGEEGKYYIWSEEEIETAVGNQEDADLIISAYGISDSGNFVGKNILRREKSDDELSLMLGVSVENVNKRMAYINSKLLQARETRIAPKTDDKVLTGWNGLMLVVFSEAGRYLGLINYAEMATRNALFLTDALLSEGSLLRSWREGKTNQSAFLEDYAALILGLLSIYQTNTDPEWFRLAYQFAEYMIEHFLGEDGLFYDTPDDYENLLIRPRDLQDNATPSGNSLAATALLQMAAYQGDGAMREIAENALRRVQVLAARYPTAFSQWLCAIDLAINPIQEVAILGDLSDMQTRSFVNTLWSQFRPHTIAAVSDYPPSPAGPKLLANRKLLNDAPTAFICEGLVCKQPLNNIEQFETHLENNTFTAK